MVPYFRKTVAFIIANILLVGCAGRAPHPVMIHQYGDDRKSCKALEREMGFIEGEISRLIPQTEKTGKNVALGVAGWFFIVPWVFMDLSKAEQMEVSAYRQRYNHLLILADEMNCGWEKDQIPDFRKQPQKNPKSEN